MCGKTGDLALPCCEESKQKTEEYQKQKTVRDTAGRTIKQKRFKYLTRAQHRVLSVFSSKLTEQIMTSTLFPFVKAEQTRKSPQGPEVLEAFF